MAHGAGMPSPVGDHLLNRRWLSIRYNNARCNRTILAFEEGFISFAVDLQAGLRVAYVAWCMVHARTQARPNPFLKDIENPWLEGL